MVDHQTGVSAVPTTAGAFVKRPGMYVGLPIRFDRVTAFIAGYTLAVGEVRGALSARDASAIRPATVEGRFQSLPATVEGQFREQLREEGRLRWNRWDLTIAAEAIGWTGDEPPAIDGFTDEEHRTAITGLAPLLERMFVLPPETATTTFDGQAGE